MPPDQWRRHHRAVRRAHQNLRTDHIITRNRRDDHWQHRNDPLRDRSLLWLGRRAACSHAVAAGLLADIAGIIASVIVCRAVFG